MSKEDQAAVAAKILRRLPDFTDPKDRHGSVQLAGTFLFVLLIALLPTLFALGTDALVPTVDAPEITLPQELTEAEAAHAARRLALVKKLTGAVPADKSAYADLATADAVGAALEVETKAATASDAGKAQADFALYRAQLLLIGGTAVSLLVIGAVLLYQLRLVRRSWNAALRPLFPPDHDRATAADFALVFAPPAILALLYPAYRDVLALDGAVQAAWLGWLGVGLAAALLSLLAAGIRGGLRKGGMLRFLQETIPAAVAGLTALVAAPVAYLTASGLSLPDGLAARALGPEGWADAMLAILITLLAATIAATHFGTRLVSRSFPDIEQVETFFDRADLDRETTHTNAHALWTAMLKRHCAPKRLHNESWRPVPVPPNAHPANARAVIEALTRALLLAVIASLVVLSLALDVLVLGHDIGDTALTDGLKGAAEAWLYLMGAGFTVAIAFVYLGPSVRVDPYVDAYPEAEKAVKAAAEAKAPKPAPEPKHWSGTLRGTGTAGLRLHLTDTAPAPPAILPIPLSGLPLGPAHRLSTAMPPLSPPVPGAAAVFMPPEPEPTEQDARSLARRLGADETKFTAILRVTNYGASFQDMLDKGLQKTSVKVLTLVAPAIATLFLNLLK